jgi:glycoprotease/Kae1 family metallohydrolase
MEEPPVVPSMEEPPVVPSMEEPPASGQPAEIAKLREQAKKLHENYRRRGIKASLKELEKLAQENPNLPEAAAFLGDIYYNDGRIAKAYSWARKAVDIDKNQSLGWWVVGLVAYEAGRKIEYVEAFREYLRLSPDDENAQQIRQLKIRELSIPDAEGIHAHSGHRKSPVTKLRRRGGDAASSFEFHRFIIRTPEIWRRCARNCFAHASGFHDSVLQEALSGAGGMRGIDAVAVRRVPGWSVPVGGHMNAKNPGLDRKTLSWASSLEATFGAVVGWPDAPPLVPRYPQLSLLVSGGHTLLFHVPDAQNRVLLGASRDDAVGEAYDKAAKILRLGYPGGPVIDRLAALGDPARYPLPVALRHSSDLDTSFSGLKTALAQLVAKLGDDVVEQDIAHLCAGFQEAVVRALVEKRKKPAAGGCRSTCAFGRRCGNSPTAGGISGLSQRHGIECVLPPRQLCTDNAAMVAAAAYPAACAGDFAD